MFHIAILAGSFVFGQDEIIENPDLGEIIEPEAIRFSFNTPGWYILAIFSCMVVVYLLIKWIINYRKNAYRREAIKQITAL